MMKSFHEVLEPFFTSPSFESIMAAHYEVGDNFRFADFTEIHDAWKSKKVLTTAKIQECIYSVMVEIPPEEILDDINLFLVTRQKEKDDQIEKIEKIEKSFQAQKKQTFTFEEIDTILKDTMCDDEIPIPSGLNTAIFDFFLEACERKLYLKCIADYIKTHTDRGPELNALRLPIEEIDSIPVDVILNYEGEEAHIHYIACYIYLAPNIEYTMADFSVRNFTVDFTIEQGIDLLMKRISLLKFDKYKGCFNGVVESSPPISEMFYALFKNDKNVKLSTRECSVCFDMTETHTSCKHQLCLVCYSKLNVVEKGWSTYSGRAIHIKQCPLCRGKIKKILSNTEFTDGGIHEVELN